MTEPIYAMPETLRQALLTYLGSRPYSEVAQGIQALLALQPVGAPPNPDQNA